MMNNIPNPLDGRFDTLPEVISFFSSILFPAVGLILFAMLIYGGITRMTAAGDADKEKESQKIMTNAVIGTVIIVMARIIIQTLASLLGVVIF